jgi:hypothetical protein
MLAMRALSKAALQQRADARAADDQSPQAAGKTLLRAIAEGLNDQRITF